jgi:hypothetical protein
VTARDRAPWALLATAVFVAAVAAPAAAALREAARELRELRHEIAEARKPEAGAPDAEPSRVNWPPDPGLIDRTTR